MDYEEQVNDCPQFGRLKEKLQEKLTESYLSKETQAKLDTARKSLEEKRKRFLKAKILNQIITDISLDSSCPLQEDISQQLTLAELTGFLDLGTAESKDGVNDCTEKITTLGLDPALLPKPTTSPEFQKVLRESIEERLFNETKSLYLIISRSEDVESRRSLIHPHLIRIHEKISDIVCDVENSRVEMRALDKSLSQAISKESSVLAEMSGLLDVLINKHYTGTKLEATSVLVQYMRAKCETIQLKLKCLELEVIQATYTKDAVKAIKLVKSRLSEKIRRTDSELASVQNTISQYRSVGEDFEPLVSQYSNILKQIQEKKWALKELTGAAV